MAEYKGKSKGKKPVGRSRKEEPYKSRSNAVNMTVYDLYGNTLPNEFVTKLINSVNEIAQKEGHGFSFTQT